MKTNYKVSIIIPAYNASEFISESIDSVLNQSYNDFEIIVVDDNSKDNTWDILQKYQKIHPKKIKILKNKKKGACAARNYGFKFSTGQFIQYLDADDILSPNKIKNQIRLFRENGSNIIVHGGYCRFYKNIDNLHFSKSEIDKNYQNPTDWLIDSWNNKGMGQTSIWITPRKIIKKTNGWNESLLINQDGEFFSRVIKYSDAILFAEDALTYYRSGILNSISQKNSIGWPKADSLLKSYMLYEANFKEMLSNYNFKKALAQNYLKFIYQFHPNYPKLIRHAEKKFYNLGFKKMWPVGGKNFVFVASFIGFRNCLMLRSIFRNLLK